MATTRIGPTVLWTSADRRSTTRRPFTDLAELWWLCLHAKNLFHLFVSRASVSAGHSGSGFLKTPQPPQLIRLRTRRLLQLMTVCAKGTSAQQESTSSRRLEVTLIQQSSIFVNLTKNNTRVCVGETPRSRRGLRSVALLPTSPGNP